MKLIPFIALAVGTTLMLAVMLFCRKWVNIKLWKTVVFSVLLTVCGYAGVKLMSFIESRNWGGQSFFGAIFFEPLFLTLLEWLLKEPHRKLLDLCASAISMMLAIQKVECLYFDCCVG